MSNVTLTIAGRRYTLACAEGEEEHLAGLADTIDARLKSMSGLTGQTEAQTLLYAALLLADELHEKGRERPDRFEVPVDAIARTLEKLAERLEKLAGELEAGQSNA